MLEETAEGLIYNPLSQSTFAFRQGPSGDGPTGAAEHLGLPSSLPLKRRALGWAMRGGCRSCWVSCWPFSAPCLLCKECGLWSPCLKSSPLCPQDAHLPTVASSSPGTWGAVQSKLTVADGPI